MLGSSELIAFVCTADRARARGFYEDVLGLELVDDTPSALVFDAHGTMLRVVITERVVAAPYTVLGWAVPDVAAALRGLAVQTVSYDGMDQDADGVWSSPDGVRVAWFRDPDGNTLSLTESA